MLAYADDIDLPLDSEKQIRNNATILMEIAKEVIWSLT